MDPRNSSPCCSRVSGGRQPREDGNHRHLVLCSIPASMTERLRNNVLLTRVRSLPMRQGTEPPCPVELGERTRVHAQVCICVGTHTGTVLEPRRQTSTARAGSDRSAGKRPRDPGESQGAVSSGCTRRVDNIVQTKDIQQSASTFAERESQTRNAHGSEGIPKAKRVLEEKTNIFPEFKTYYDAAGTALVWGGERRRRQRRRNS